MSCCERLKKKILVGHAHFTTSSAHSEKGKRFEVILKKGKAAEHVCKILIDGGLISDKRKEKCDCVFYLCPSGKFLFVELKGKTWPKPYNQILATLNHFKNDLALAIPKTHIEAYIVSGALPKARTNIRDAINEFKKNHGHNLKVSTNQYSYSI